MSTDETPHAPPLDSAETEPTAPSAPLAAAQEVQLPELIGLDGQPLVAPTGLGPGQIMRVFLAVNSAMRPGHHVLVEAFCPTDEAALQAVIHPNWREGDPRSSCVVMASEFLPKLMEAIEPSVIIALRLANYPAVVDDQGQPYPEGTWRPGAEPMPGQFYYCHPESPHSAMQTFWFCGLPPVVLLYPGDIVPREACGICPACDPKREVAGQVEAALRAAARITPPTAS